MIQYRVRISFKYEGRTHTYHGPVRTSRVMAVQDKQDERVMYPGDRATDLKVVVESRVVSDWHVDTDEQPQ